MARLTADNGLVVKLKEAEPATWVMDAATGIAKRSAPRRSTPSSTPARRVTRGVRRSTTAIRTAEPFLDTNVPALLTEGLFYADGQMEDEVYNYASFVQSKMYRAGVTCHDCHDPHRLEVFGNGNETCGRCHLPENSMPSRTITIRKARPARAASPATCRPASTW